MEFMFLEEVVVEDDVLPLPIVLLDVQYSVVDVVDVVVVLCCHLWWMWWNRVRYLFGFENCKRWELESKHAILSVWVFCTLKPMHIISLSKIDSRCLCSLPPYRFAVAMGFCPIARKAVKVAVACPFF